MATTDKFKNKLRLLYILKILYEKSNEEHKLSRYDIQEKLAEYGIASERKTFYDDLAALNEFGIEIISEKDGHDTRYAIVDRSFELAELKILVDSVQASRFITQKKSKELIRKLEGLGSEYDADKLDRFVYSVNKAKTDNEMILCNIDIIYSAINDDKKIVFNYFDWSSDRKKVLRHNGKRYKISPWALIWDNLNYYLIGFDEESSSIRHYRVDKMIKLEADEESRVGKEAFKNFNVGEYSGKLFGMFDGDEETVTLQVDESMISVIFDRFGTEIPVRKNESGAEVDVNVLMSDQFISWVLALGNGVKIISPETVVEKVRKYISERAKLYDVKE